MEKEVPRPASARPSAQWVARAQAWRGDRRVAAALLACIAVAAGCAWYRAGASPAPPPGPPASTGPAAPAASSRPAVSSTTTSRPAAAAVLVDVVGAVRRTGVVELAPGARVIDAIRAAGGATADADLVRLNLAAVLADGARVAVPRVGAPAPEVDPSAVTGSAAPGGGGDPTSSAPVDLNTATADQLDTLPGVGPATAAAIIKDRETNGPFRSVNDLGRVRGIGDAKLEQLRDLVTV